MIGTTPTVDPVKTQKSLSILILSFLILFKTNFRELSGLIKTVLVFPSTLCLIFLLVILVFKLPILIFLYFFFLAFQKFYICTKITTQVTKRCDPFFSLSITDNFNARCHIRNKF